MTIESQDTIMSVHLISAGIYVLYFAIYYGRYSTLNQKLNGIQKIEKAAVADPSVVERSKINTERKIMNWKKRCYLPIPFIAVAHIIGLYNILHSFHLSVYLVVVYVAIGGFLLIRIGNYTKGAQIFDPNRKFTNTGRPW